MVGGLGPEGFATFAPDAHSLAWARAAAEIGREVARDPEARAANLRHGDTWFVGVDALPNAPDGAVAGLQLRGPWGHLRPPRGLWHRAQLSIVYPGYPGGNPGESDGALRYRRRRAAAHVDGLLPVGPERRRYPREFHAFVLGIALSDASAAPTVCWPGSHRIIAAALREAIGERDPAEVDVTDAYHAARRDVFEKCQMVPLDVGFGGAFLLHRFLLHGTASWHGKPDANGRMIAFFRPEFETSVQWRDAV